MWTPDIFEIWAQVIAPKQLEIVDFGSPHYPLMDFCLEQPGNKRLWMSLSPTMWGMRLANYIQMAIGVIE